MEVDGQELTDEPAPVKVEDNLERTCRKQRTPKQRYLGMTTDLIDNAAESTDMTELMSETESTDEAGPVDATKSMSTTASTDAAELTDEAEPISATESTNAATEPTDITESTDEAEPTGATESTNAATEPTDMTELTDNTTSAADSTDLISALYITQSQQLYGNPLVEDLQRQEHGLGPPNALQGNLLSIRSLKCQFQDPRRLEEALYTTWSSALFEKIGLDVVHMPRCKGKNYLVVAREDLSGWAEARALASANSAAIAKFLWEDVVCRHGCFGKLVVNGGPENKGRVAAFTKKYDIDRVQVSAYHPAANGMVERGHKPITDALAKLTDGGLGNWVRNLPTVLFADRTSVHQPTGKTPFWVVYGREAILPIELKFRT